MIFARLLLLLLTALPLSACTFFFDVQDIAADSDSAPDSKQVRAIANQIYKITEQMKLTGKPEISAVGPNEAQSGPEKWTVCLRSEFPTGRRYFAFFLKGDAVTNWRPAVINDRCGERSFVPLERTQ